MGLIFADAFQWMNETAADLRGRGLWVVSVAAVVIVIWFLIRWWWFAPTNRRLDAIIRELRRRGP